MKAWVRNEDGGSELEMLGISKDDERGAEVDK